MKQTSLKGNFVLNAILAMSGFLFPLITFPYVSRILQPAGTGRVAFATSVISYFSMFAQLGIPTYGIRACAKVRDDRAALSRTVHELLSINLVMDIISYGMLAVALVLIPRLKEDRVLFLVLSTTILLNTLGMEWLFKALEQYRYITVRSLVFKLVALAAVFLLVKQESDCVLYGGISIFAASASNLMNLLYARKFVDGGRMEGTDWKRHLKPVMIFFALSCAATVYTNLDALMLGFMTTNADVGYYNAAVKVKTVLVSLVTSLGAVLLPRSSYYVEQGRMEEFRRMSRKALQFVLLLASALMLYFMLFAEDCILLLSGEAYRNAVVPMQVIMPTVLFIGLTNILGIQMLVPMGREKTVLKSEIAGAVVDLILNALLIPSWKATGAAVGTLVAEAVVLFVQYGALKSEVRGILTGFRWKNLLVGLFLAVVSCCWIRQLHLSTLVALVLSAGLFFGVYGMWLLVRKETLVSELLNQVRQRVNRNQES